jgi:DNA replication protein DnaC
MTCPSKAAAAAPCPDLVVRRRIAHRVAALGLPAVFGGTRFETLDPSFEPEAFRLCEEYADTGYYRGHPGLLLMGAVGCGKTALAIAIARRTIERTEGRHDIAFWSVPGASARLRDALVGGSGRRPDRPAPAIGPGVRALGLAPTDEQVSGAAAQALALAAAADPSPAGPLELLRHHLVVVDDLVPRRLPVRLAEQLYVLVDAFWSGARQLVITTNQSPADLGAGLGPAVLSRLLGLCQVVVVGGRDLRACCP